MGGRDEDVEFTTVEREGLNQAMMYVVFGVRGEERKEEEEGGMFNMIDVRSPARIDQSHFVYSGPDGPAPA